MTPQDPNQPADENQDTSFGQLPSSDTSPTTPGFGEGDTSSLPSDSESLQAIENFESEDTSVQPAETFSATPVETPQATLVESQPAVAGAYDTQAYTPAQPVEPTPSATPVEASAAGLAAAAGAKAGQSFGTTQVPTSNPASAIGAPKKKSKLVLILVIVIIGLGAGIGGFFVWQSSQASTTPSGTTTTETGGDLPGGGNGDVKVDAQVIQE